MYERLVREFGDQTEAAGIARARLGAATTANETGIVVRKVWSDGNLNIEAAVSADGRYITYPHWSTGALGLRDLVTGTTRTLTEGGYINGAYAEGSAISRDGNRSPMPGTTALIATSFELSP